MAAKRGSLCLGLMSLSIALAVCAAACVARPDLGAAFFRGKTVTIVVPHGPGGMDSYARLIAPFLQKHLAGSRFVVSNVREGGGLAGRNQVYEALPDGLTLGFTTGGGTLLAQWADQPGVLYDAASFSYIGRIAAEARVLVASPKAGLSSLGGLVRARRISMGFAGIGSDDYYVGLIAARLLGFAVDARTAYTSVSDAGLACVRGEVDAILFSDSSVRPLIRARSVVPIAVFSDERLPSLPDVPTVYEFVQPADQGTMRSLVRIYALDRALFGPPELPAPRLKALRAALDAAIADPEFLLSAKKLKRPVDYLPGAETRALLEGVLSSRGRIGPLVLEIARGAK
jgi:tripartite-type tricarboxylate transporter receptor subunit TctC